MFRLRLFGSALLSGLAMGSVAKAASYSEIYAFKGGTSISGPRAGLNRLYGTIYGTSLGGSLNDGTIFSFNGTATVRYNFKGGTDGESPSSQLIQVGRLMYGATFYGGGAPHCDLGCGTVFSFDPKTGTENVLYAFQGKKQGYYPAMKLLPLGGKLYGIASGGVYNAGMLFSIDIKTGQEKTLYSFSGGDDGSGPDADLLEVDGIFYSTTTKGGTHGHGTVFSFNPVSGEETVLHSFHRNDGKSPTSGLIQVGKELFGLTGYGGAYNSGVLFSIHRQTGVERVICSFGAGTLHSILPQGDLKEYGGLLYGTTLTGGEYGGGTVFSVDPLTGSEVVIHYFTGYGGDGVAPDGALMSLHGTLYGTTGSGGQSSNEAGTIYTVTP